MKISLILTSLLFLFCSNKKSKCNNDFNFKGKVQNVEETTKYPDYEMKSIYFLNDNDFVLSIEDYNSNNLIEKKEFKYDKNNIIQEIKISDSKGKNLSKSNFIKNKKNQIEKTLINTSNSESVIIHHYEENSEFSNSGKELDEKGKIIRSWKLEYKNNLVSEQSNCNPDGTIINQTIFIYNDNNDLVEVIEKDKNGEILNRQFLEYQYDNKKNWIEKKMYDSNKNLVSTSTRKIKYW